MLFEIIDRGFLGLAAIVTGNAFRPKEERNISRRVPLGKHAHVTEEWNFGKIRVRFSYGQLYLLDELGYIVTQREKRVMSIKQGRYMSPEEAAEVLYAEYYTPEPQLDRNHRFNRVARVASL